MKKALILLALAGVAASACGGDDGKDNSDKVTSQKDGGTDAGSAPRPQQIDNGKVGIACTMASEKTDCTGVGGTCETVITGMTSYEFPGGYCTANCQATAECGTGAACPVADLVANLPSLLSGVLNTQTIAQFGIPSICLKTCTQASDCREGYNCAGGADLAGGQIPAMYQSTIQQFFGSTKYCMPPVPMGDGGVANVGDAGVKALSNLGGLDAGL